MTVEAVNSIQFNLFIDPKCMHNNNLLNICNTAILGYHGDKIILYNNVSRIEYVKDQ